MHRTNLKIELFNDCVMHLCRLNRILRQLGGNALLIGVGGSGKKSLVRLSSEMAGCLVSEIEPRRNCSLREFRKEVFEKMLYPAGVEGKPVTFLFTDNHVLQESFLEEVNNLITTGDMELERDLMEKMKKDIELVMIQEKSELEDKEFYIKRVRQNLHIILAMSPVGNTLRTRLRNFPSFVNCCTVDWVDTWPDEALRSIATKSIKEDMTEQGFPEEVTGQIVDMCVLTHSLV